MRAGLETTSWELEISNRSEEDDTLQAAANWNSRPRTCQSPSISIHSYIPTYTYISTAMRAVLSLRGVPHPLDPLAVEEINLARDAIRKARGSVVSLVYRDISLDEPPKALMIPFLEAEHAGNFYARTQRPPRVAKVLYDVITADRKSLDFCCSMVNVTTAHELSYEVIDKRFHSPLNAWVASHPPPPQSPVAVQLTVCQR